MEQIKAQHDQTLKDILVELGIQTLDVNDCRDEEILTFLELTTSDNVTVETKIEALGVAKGLIMAKAKYKACQKTKGVQLKIGGRLPRASYQDLIEKLIDFQVYYNNDKLLAGSKTVEDIPPGLLEFCKFHQLILRVDLENGEAQLHGDGEVLKVFMQNGVPSIPIHLLDGMTLTQIYNQSYKNYMFTKPLPALKLTD